MVMWVDHDRRSADLIPIDQLDLGLEEDVPFEAIQQTGANLHKIERIPFSAVEPLEEDS
jgi:hypothetical protein